MKVYIAGAMTGLPDYNYPAFFAAERRLMALGYTVLNPARNGGGDTSKEYAWYMRRALEMVLQADAIYLLPGWEESRGATLEKAVADALGLRQLFI